MGSSNKTSTVDLNKTEGFKNIYKINTRHKFSLLTSYSSVAIKLEKPFTIPDWDVPDLRHQQGLFLIQLICEGFPDKKRKLSKYLPL